VEKLSAEFVLSLVRCGRTLVKQEINHPYVDGLYQLFMVKLRMVFQHYPTSPNPMN
jgi:hypothetical protein